MKLERSENVKIINGYLKDNCRFQLDSIAEDSIYRDITATGRTYLYKNHAFEYPNKTEAAVRLPLFFMFVPEGRMMPVNYQVMMDKDVALVCYLTTNFFPAEM